MRRFILGVIYVFARLLVKLMFGVYFSEQVIINRKNLYKKGPAILLSNHPNGMLDPINVAARSNRMVHFLAKAELFRHPFLNWFFNTLYCIPIERPDFMNGNKVDNTQNFERCNQFLKASGTLYIAPEGTSLLVRRLLPLKTGAARIALQAEASADFNLGLQLIPTGITYVDQGEFRSEYLMEVGEAFSISSFKEQYQTDPKAAVISLTDLIQNKMQQLVIQLDNDEHIELFEYLIRAFNKDIETEPYKFYVEGKILAIRLNYLNDYASDKLNIINREFEELKQIASKLKLRSHDIPEVLSPWSVGDWIQNFLISIIYLPLFLGGITYHLLANFIPWSIEKLLRLHIIYRSTVKMLSGLVIYPVIYSIQLYLLWHYFHDIEKIIIYIISFVISGLMFFPLLRLYRKLFLHIKVISKQNEDYNLLRNKILTLKDLINK